MKKVGKATRPFRYATNKIPYEYTVEVMNRFKGLDPVDRLPKKLWTEVHNSVQEVHQNHLQKKKRNARKQNYCLRNPYK